jgi:hypothetical protein
MKASAASRTLCLWGCRREGCGGTCAAMAASPHRATPDARPQNLSRDTQKGHASMTTTVKLEEDYREAVARMDSVQKQLGAMTRDDPGRAGLISDLESVVARVRELKEAIKRMGMQHNFAGCNSPLHAACVARLDPAVVAELETDALARQAEQERSAAERRAAKAAVPPAAPATPPAAPAPPPLPRPPSPTPPTLASKTTATMRGPGPEVFHARPRSSAPVQPVLPAAPPSAGAPRGPVLSERRREVAALFQDARRGR